MKSIEDIKAVVKYKWDHHKHKFLPGDRARVNHTVLDLKWTDQKGNARVGKSYHSRPIVEHAGQEGNVLAVSCTPDGKTRGRPANGYTERQFTRYYVQFNDGNIIGIHSHCLDKV